MNVLSEIEETAKKKSLPSIGPLKGEIIGNLIRKYKLKRILEIGTLHGYSAILMANFILNVKKEDDNDNDNINTETIITCLEIDQQVANIAKKNIEKAGLSDRIEVITGDALKIIPTLNNKYYRFDLVFIDAVKNQYLSYLKLVEENSLLNKKSIVVADNVLIYENEMKDYLDYVRNSGKYNSYTTDTTLEFTKIVKDALEVSISSAGVVIS
ncbi:MAG TPA: class I SAM-dependent methyltransferase [Nitrososphaeraceae archaeon]|nr:class I SAM-dependent methyltransferase [Nitrososphaeraceae archaeon]